MPKTLVWAVLDLDITHATNGDATNGVRFTQLERQRLRRLSARGRGRLGLSVVLCDVQTPWERCADVYGPQKGADREMVRRLAERLDALAGELPRDPRGVPMTGAAGGLSGGLWAGLGAELVPGAPYVLDTVGFDQRLRQAAAVIVGEGRMDEQR
jgi:glycerate kinase